MTADSQLVDFPEATQIPKPCKLDNRLDQQVYLVNGELRTWKGDRQEVLSPI